MYIDLSTWANSLYIFFLFFLANHHCTVFLPEFVICKSQRIFAINASKRHSLSVVSQLKPPTNNFLQRTKINAINNSNREFAKILCQNGQNLFLSSWDENNRRLQLNSSTLKGQRNVTTYHYSKLLCKLCSDHLWWW